MLVFEELVLSSLIASVAFNETIFHTGWMARVEMCIVKGFSRFEVRFDVQNGFVYESFCFDHALYQGK